MRGTQYDGQFQVATFDEIIDFVAAESAARGRVIGLIPEIKHGTFFQQRKLAMEDKVIAALNQALGGLYDAVADDQKYDPDAYLRALKAFNDKLPS